MTTKLSDKQQGGEDGSTRAGIALGLAFVMTALLTCLAGGPWDVDETTDTWTTDGLTSENGWYVWCGDDVTFNPSATVDTASGEVEVDAVWEQLYAEAYSSVSGTYSTNLTSGALAIGEYTWLGSPGNEPSLRIWFSVIGHGWAKVYGYANESTESGLVYAASSLYHTNEINSDPAQRYHTDAQRSDFEMSGYAIVEDDVPEADHDFSLGYYVSNTNQVASTTEDSGNAAYSLYIQYDIYNADPSHDFTPDSSFTVWAESSYGLEALVNRESGTSGDSFARAEGEFDVIVNAYWEEAF